MRNKNFVDRQRLCYICSQQGELAHLVERLHGMQEVTGSIPVFSTKKSEPPKWWLFCLMDFVCYILFSEKTEKCFLRIVYADDYSNQFVG